MASLVMVVLVTEKGTWRRSRVAENEVWLDRPL